MAEDDSASAWLAELLGLGARIDAMLANAPAPYSADGAFRVRLARAHVLNFVDEIRELGAPPRSSSIPRAPQSGTTERKDAPKQKASTR